MMSCHELEEGGNSTAKRQIGFQLHFKAGQTGFDVRCVEYEIKTSFCPEQLKEWEFQIFLNGETWEEQTGSGNGCRGLSLGILGFYVLIRYLSGHVEETVGCLSLEFRVSLHCRYKSR